MNSSKQPFPTAPTASATSEGATIPTIQGMGKVPDTQPPHQPIRLRPSRHRSRNLLLDLPIARRLTLGFLLAGLIAALIAGVIGMQRSQSLSRQSSFYQTLLSTNTSLTTGANFLQLMNTETHTVLDVASAPSPSQETLGQDQKAIANLSAQYDAILNNYIAHDQLSRHPDQLAVLAEANHSNQVVQQQILAASTLRTWRFYRAAQTQILQDVTAGNLAEAQALERTQAELTNSDALSAVRSLIQFDGRLAASVHDAAAVEEQNQLIRTIIGSILAFICIALVGLFVSNTLVRRLRALRHVTQAVEHGQIDARVDVIGRDEIADVSASVNAMLETITGLLAETRSQRDALTNAAEHLFSEMRIVSAGDLRVNAPVSDDPIGLLANAFNFTVGRFRRFVLHTQTATEQLEVLVHQELERSEQFLKALNSQVQAQYTTSIPSSPFATIVPTPIPTPRSTSAVPQKRRLSRELGASQAKEASEEATTANALNQSLLAQVKLMGEHLQALQSSSDLRDTQALLALVEQIPTTLERLARLMNREAKAHNRSSNSTITQGYIRELQTLDTAAQRMASELQQRQQTQQQATQALTELDTDIHQLTTLTRRLIARGETSLPFRTKETEPDTIRLSVAFAQEMTTLTRRLAKVAHEMRGSTIAFQLDAPKGRRE